MNLINNFRSYINEEEFKITILKNRVNIVNYEKMGHFDNNKIVVYHEYGQIIIKGEKLVISKLMNEEILITGIIKSIEMGYNEK